MTTLTTEALPIKRKYGWKRDLHNPKDKIYTTPYRAEPLPPLVDLRPMMGAVLDQGSLGSCVENSFASLLMYVQRKAEVPEILLPSRLFMYYNVRVLNDTVDSDSGSSVADGITSLTAQGVCAEKLWGYDHDYRIRPQTSCYADAVKHLVTDYRRVLNLYDIKSCLADGNVLVGGFSVFASFEGADVAKTGLMPIPDPNEELRGGHCVTFCGFSDEKRCLIVKNSWSEKWGAHGFFYMPYEIVESGAASDFWCITKEA